MKRISILVAMLMACSIVSFAQWNTSGTNINNTNTGNVGIGTPTPLAKLHVQDGNGGEQIRLSRGTGSVRFAQDLNQDNLYLYNSTGFSMMFWKANGYIGIGTTNPQDVLHLAKTGNSQLVLQDLSSAADGVGGGIRFLGNTSGVAGGNYFATIQGVKAPTTGGGILKLFTSDNVGNSFERLRIDNTGNVGIGTGTSTPTEKLMVMGNIYIPLASSFGFLQSQDKFTYDSKAVGNYSLGWYNDSWQTGAPSGYLSAYGGLKIFTNQTMRLAVTYDGNVGIGTSIPDAKLAVKGTIHAQEVKVDLSVPGPDYVFDEAYDLPSLTEIETYINQNKHLPDVPSACEMEEDGINLSEMNMILLKKVEELTLYLLEQQKVNDEQSLQIKKLNDKIENLNK